MKRNNLHCMLMAGLTIMASCHNPHEMLVRGRITAHPRQWIYLSFFRDGELQVADSACTRKDGSFHMQVLQDHTDIYRLQVSSNNYIDMILEQNSDVFIEVTGEYLAIPLALKGAKFSHEMLNFNELFRQLEIALDTNLDKAVHETDLSRSGEYIGEGIRLENGYRQLIRDEIFKYRDSNGDPLLTLYLATRTFSGSPLFYLEDDLLVVYSLVTEARKLYPHSSFVANAAAQVEAYAVTGLIRAHAESMLSTGNRVKDIELKTLAGKTSSLLDQLDKMTMLYFWRSDCYHCRAMNSQLKHVNEIFSGKGLAIYSVSLDDDLLTLEEYLATEHLDWPVVSDLKGWESPLALDFNITGTPTIFILNEDGIILERILGSTDLDELIAKYLS